MKKINHSKKIFSLIFTAFFVSSFLFPVFNSFLQVSAIQPPSENAYTITFNGVTYDNQDYTSTWSYTITRTGEGHDLSHWVWQPCFSEQELNERFLSATPEADEVGYDPSTGHYGVKWEVGDGFTQGTFTVTIKGQPVVDNNGAIGVIKAANAHFEVVIPGPDCSTYTIAGMKFEDKNGDGERGCGEEGLSGWQITIEGPGQFSDTAITYFGLYYFSDLYPGTYIVCEVLQEGWEQTYPTENDGCYIIEITNLNATSINFGNRQIPEGPICGDGNLDDGEECDDGENNGVECIPEYGSSCIYCSLTCENVELDGPYCGDEIKNGDEECDNTDGIGEHQTCDQDCTLINLTYCGDETKQSPNDEGTGGPHNDGYEECDVQDGVGLNEACTQECVLINIEHCGDGIINGGEECDEGAENGQSCTPPYEGQCTYCSDVCTNITLDGPYCGDGIVDDPYEECEEDEDCCCGEVCDNCQCVEEPEIPLTIIAYKVVCETEEDLPNWGDGISGPPQITINTAIDYVNESQTKCWLKADWEFQWGLDNAQKQDGAYIGSAPEGTGWNDFDSSTGEGTPAQVQITDLEGTSVIWVRENLKENYVPFTYPPEPSPGSNVSAEIYCHTDVYKYDNYERIDSPQLDETYYCIAFNAPVSEPEPYCGDGNLDEGEQCDDGNNEDGDGCSSQCQLELVCNPDEELVINGGFEEPIVTSTKNWNIFTGLETPGWTIEWNSSEPSYKGTDRPIDAYLELHRSVFGWLPFAGEQYAELDADWDGPGSSLSGEPASTKIYQDIPTIPGETYNIKFHFSPRPDTDSENNILEFSWDGEVKATTTDEGLSNTNWSEYVYNFTATCNTTRLQFADLGTPDSLGTFLDDVSVRCIPQLEPYCGDGNVDPGEQCDNGELNDQECTPPCEQTCTYCSSDCQLITLQGGSCGSSRGTSGGTVMTFYAPKLTIEKSVAEPFANPGSTINYTIVVKNTGSAVAYNIILTDTLPDGFTYTDTGSSTREWDLGTRGADTEETITYQVSVGGDVEPGDYLNTAEVKADDLDPVSDQVTIEIREGEVLGETITILPKTGVASSSIFLILFVSLASLILGTVELKKTLIFER